MAVATENELNNYGYQLLGNKQFDKAIACIKGECGETSCIVRIPGIAWVKHMHCQEIKKMRFANFKKSLSLNPPNLCKSKFGKIFETTGSDVKTSVRV